MKTKLNLLYFSIENILHSLIFIWCCKLGFWLGRQYHYGLPAVQFLLYCIQLQHLQLKWMLSSFIWHLYCPLNKGESLSSGFLWCVHIFDLIQIFRIFCHTINLFYKIKGQKGLWSLPSHSLVKNNYSISELHLTGFHCAIQMTPCNRCILSTRTRHSQGANGLVFTSFSLISKWSLSFRNWTARASKQVKIMWSLLPKQCHETGFYTNATISYKHYQEKKLI